MWQVARCLAVEFQPKHVTCFVSPGTATGNLLAVSQSEGGRRGAAFEHLACSLARISQFLERGTRSSCYAPHFQILLSALERRASRLIESTLFHSGPAGWAGEEIDTFSPRSSLEDLPVGGRCPLRPLTECPSLETDRQNAWHLSEL